jgi:7-cyano-7-deazaguanine synthase
MKSVALVVLSGGQDSTTCLFEALDAHDEVHAITFGYGQYHEREIACAEMVARFARVASHEVLQLGDHILHSTSPLLKSNDYQPFPDSLAMQPNKLANTWPTFVPMRNQLFLTIAANRAVELNARYIYIGACKADYEGYPDCRDAFLHSIERAINWSNGVSSDGTLVVAPLLRLSKADIVRRSLMLHDCWEALAMTHTSYSGEYPPELNDHAAIVRAHGFQEAGIPDPLVLRAVCEGLMCTPETANYSHEAVRHYLPRLTYAMKVIKQLSQGTAHAHD